jgi:putative ABC transport system permease protein
MTPMRRLVRWLSASGGTGAAAVLALGLLAGVAVFAAVAGPRQGLAVRTKALQQEFATMPATERSVQASADWRSAESAIGHAISASEIGKVTQELAGVLASVPLPASAPSADWGGLTTPYDRISGAARSARTAGASPQMELVFRDSLGRHSRLVSGREPGLVSLAGGLSGAARGRALGIAVTPATAARFGLRPGSRLVMHVPARPVTLVVTGIIKPAGAAGTFWTLDPVAAAPSLNRNQPARGRQPGLEAAAFWAGAAFVGPGELAAVQEVFGAQGMHLLWDFPLALGQVTADQVQALDDRLNRAAAQAGTAGRGALLSDFGLSVTTGLVIALAGFTATQSAIEAIGSLLFIGLTVIGAVVVWLAAGMIAERRGGELAAMRARGASLRQIAGVMLRGGALAVLPAAAAGTGLAVALTPGGGTPLAWWLGGATLLVALAAPAAIAVRRHRAVDPAPERTLDRAAVRRTAARRWVAEVTLVAACVGGLIVLREQGLSPVGGINVYTSAAPVLVAVPAALIILRLCPLVLRGLLRLAAPRAGVAGFVGLATGTRAALTAALPAFALVLALAMAAFSGMVKAAVSRGQVAASWRSTGADAVVDASQVPDGLSAAAVRAIAAVPGAQQAAAASVTVATVNGGSGVTVAAVDPARYAALVAATPWPAAPRVLPERAPAGWSPGIGSTPGRGVVPVIASPAAVAELGRGRVQLPLDYAPVTIRVAATVRATPALPGAGVFVLLPTWATRNRISAPPPPTRMLVTGTHLDEHALSAAARRTAPDASVTFRSAVLAALAGAPLQHAADVFFTEGAALAAGLAGAILLLGLALDARARDHALVRLRVLGLGRGQGRLLLAAQTLPQVIAAVAGGLACAWLLGPLLGPDLNLSIFTGSTASVPVRPEYPALVLPAAVLLVLAVAALAVQAGLTARRGAAGVLRVGE